MIRGFIEPRLLEDEVLSKLKEKGITELDYPLNPYELILNEGIILQEECFDNENIRGMLVHGKNASGILINSSRKRESKIFIAMHELSHFWFHPRTNQRVCIENYIDSNRHYEWQANNAAAYALMPTKLLSRLYYESGGNIDCLCNFFGVGRDTMIYRLKNVNFKVNKESFTIYDKCVDLREFHYRAANNNWLYK